jgi:cell division septation protein DedD
MEEEVGTPLNDAVGAAGEETRESAAAPTSRKLPAPPAPVPTKKKEEVAKEIDNIIKVQESLQKKPTTYADTALSKAKMEEPRRIAKAEANPPSEFDEEPAPAPKKPAPTASAAAPASAGTWQLQLMATPNKSAAEKAYGPLAKKYGILAGYSHEIEEADLGAKGMFYRLKIGAFKTRAEADSLCKDLPALGGTCIVKKK